MSGDAPRLRVDKWLWYARFFKTRSLATRVVSEGRVRLNAARIENPAQTVQAGDVLTFPQARAVRVVRVLALGARRGPAPEAAALYEDLGQPTAPRATSGPRPTKKDRRGLPPKGILTS